MEPIVKTISKGSLKYKIRQRNNIIIGSLQLIHSLSLLFFAKRGDLSRYLWFLIICGIGNTLFGRKYGEFERDGDTALIQVFLYVVSCGFFIGGFSEERIFLRISIVVIELISIIVINIRWRKDILLNQLKKLKKKKHRNK